MRRSRAVWAGVLCGLTVAVGCRHESNYTDVPTVEEWKEPPHEARFDNPPEQGYQKPRAKKEFKAGPQNAPGMPGGGGTMGGGMSPGGRY
jgi:hypothetical protein